MQVQWSAPALSDLENISTFLEAATSLQTANRITRAIYETVQKLKALPNRGRPGRIASTRELLVPKLPYIVVYRVLVDRVAVVRILHGAKQWP
jgi:addiction module RelE/StbE family toxin